MKHDRRTGRQCRFRLVCGVCLLVAFVTACSHGGGAHRLVGQTPTRGPATSTTSTSAVPSPSPTTTLVGGHPVSLTEVADIEAAVRGYFAAFGGSGRGLERYSSGELGVLAKWQRTLSSSSFAPGNLRPAAGNIDSLKLISVTRNTATAEIKGQLAEELDVVTGQLGRTDLVSTNIDGAVTLVRRTGWRLTNFHRAGKWVTDQLYTNVRGQQTGQGVVVTVVGVDLRPKGTMVVMAVNNTAALAADAINPTIRDAAGNRRPSAAGQDVQVLEVAPQSRTSKQFYFPEGLRANTRTFNFEIEFILGSYISATMDIPVQLVR
jgi:hypothetical protein